MINITCNKCRSTTEQCGNKKVKFCPNCGSRFPINAKKEQPFHLPENGPDIPGMVEKSIKDIDRLLTQRYNFFPLELVKSLIECREILLNVQKGDRSNRQECRSMLEKMKDEREQVDWDEQLKNIDKI